MIIFERGEEFLGTLAGRGHLTRFRDALTPRPLWVFSSGPVGDPSSKLVQKMGEDPLNVAEIRAAAKARDHRVFADWPEIQGLATQIARELAHAPVGRVQTHPRREEVLSWPRDRCCSPRIVGRPMCANTSRTKRTSPTAPQCPCLAGFKVER